MCSLAVCTKIRRKQSFSRCDHTSSRTIAEQHAGRTVLIVRNFGQKLCSHDQNMLHIVHCQISPRHIKRIYKSGTGAVDINTRRIDCSDQALHHTGHGRTHIIGRHTGMDDQIDIRSREACICNCLFRRLHTHQISRRAVGNMPRFNAGARSDPFIRGFDNFHIILI